MEDSTQVVEENNQSVPTDETTLTEQTSNTDGEQTEQAVDESSQVVDEPSETSADVVEPSEVKPTRFQQRINKKNAEIAQLREQLQPSPAQFLPTEAPKIEAGMEYDAETLDQILEQKASAQSGLKMAQFAATLQAKDTVNQYVQQLTEDNAALSKWDVLNPNSPHFDEELLGDIYEEFDEKNPIEVNGQYNPNVKLNLRLTDVAEKWMKNVERYRTQGQIESKADLAAAADSAVLAPGGTSPDTTAKDSVEALRDKLAGYTF